jgi:3-methyladenine DNA glycosylase AlkD
MTEEYIDQLKLQLEPHVNPAKGAEMSAYMKGHFPFLGIQSKQREELARPFYDKQSRPQNFQDLDSIVKNLWELPEREYQYIAMQLALKCKSLWTTESIDLFEWMIKNKSWWDTVDFIAANLVGGYMKQFPKHIHIITAFNSSGNLWLERTAILYQLKYKNEVDTDILESCITRHADSKEFFHRKAIGWALRQYSKLNPKWVKSMLAKYSFSGLTVREASKYLTV